MAGVDGLPHQVLQVAAGDLGPVVKGQERPLGALLDQEAFHLAIVLLVLFGRLALDLVERGLGDIEIPGFDQRTHLAEEER